MSRKPRPKKISKTSELYKTNGQQNNTIFIRPVLEPKNESQAECIRLIAEKDIIFIGGAAGTGKAQPLFCKVLTPTGFKKMADIKVGDEVITPKNTITKVIAEHYQGKKEIFKVTFHDKSYTLCCKEHLWSVKNNTSNSKLWPKVISLEEIKNRLNSNKKGWYIDCTKPLDFPTKELDIDPYTMGVLLGDGSFRSSMINITCADKFIIKKIKSNNPDTKIKKSKNKKYYYSLSKFNKKIKNIGLLSLKSENKFIPDQYFISSKEQRVELLRGLLDTDGTVCKKGRTIYYTTSAKLRDGVIELVNSLGGIVFVREKTPKYKYKGENRIGKVCYILTINLNNDICPFSLPRKIKRITFRTKYFPRRLFKKIEPFGEEECKCITLEDKDGLYITDNYIVTHNSHCSVAYGLLAVLKGKFEKLILVRPAVTTEEIGLLPGSLDEKVLPFMEPVLDIINKFITKEEFDKLKKEGRIQIKSMAYLRGVTCNNSFIVVDEGENLSHKQMKLIVTRIGEGSKLVIQGDETQSDLKKYDRGALTKHIELFSDFHPKFGSFRFQDTDIVRNPLITVYLDRIKDADTENN